VSILAGGTENLQVQAVDTDNQSLTLSASNLPSFVTFTDNQNGIGTLAIAPQASDAGTYSITITANDGELSGSGTITLTVTGTELLPSGTTWQLVGDNGDAQQDETLPADTLSGMGSAQVTFDLHGATFGTADDEASIVFVQNGQWFCANVIVNGAQNGYDGSQTLTIPLNQFHQFGTSTPLDTTQAVSNLHTRFWNSGAFTVDITSIVLLPQTTQSPPPPPPPFAVYDNTTGGLASNWGDWSWCADNNLADASSVYAGSYDLSWTVTCQWGGLSLHLPSGFDTTGYTSLTFALEASQSGQRVQVSFYDSDGNTGEPVQLDNYGGTPVAGQYTLYTIPLSDFQSTTTITGILIQDISGNDTEPPMYVGTIEFQ
jgi:hypothetical protein